MFNSCVLNQLPPGDTKLNSRIASLFVVCAQRAGRSALAESTIRDRLKVKETPALYCSLADVTGDIQYYENAWELSEYKSARAQRGLAFHYVRAQEVGIRCEIVFPLAGGLLGVLF